MTAQDFKNYYQILGVSQDASAEEIKKAYRQLARKHHPDLHPGDKSAENRLKEINEAQELLSDPQKRQKYDQYCQYWQQTKQGGKGFNLELNGFNFGQYASFGDFVNDILDRVGISQKYKTFGDQTFFYDGIKDSLDGLNGLQPEDSEGSLSLTFLEAFRGTEQQLIIGDEIVKAHIPPGAKTGSCLRIKGKGKLSSLSKKRGNLYLNIELQPHPLFRLEGDNLVAEIPITPEEAVLGAEIAVPTPEGKVTLKVPRQVDSGQSLELKAKGWYKPNQQRSDLIIVLKIVTPKYVTMTEEECYQKIQQASKFKPRQSLEDMRL